jgi:hypothetical protein
LIADSRGKPCSSRPAREPWGQALSCGDLFALSHDEALYEAKRSGKNRVGIAASGKAPQDD